MSVDWLSWSNPLAIWWSFLVVVSILNIVLWFGLRRQFRTSSNIQFGIFRVELMLLLCGAYVFGCAFRSVLPRADVQRICLFDTWLSSVMLGRSVATIAEICFVIQWAIVLRQLAAMTRSDTVRNISRVIVPLIVVAECCSWYAVVTTNYLGNAVENSLWAISFVLIIIALARLLSEFRGIVRFAIGAVMIGVAGYVAFLIAVDIPMYVARAQADLAVGKAFLGAFTGLHDVATRWVVTHDVAEWKDEMAWMGLYFSLAVWSSLALCGFDLIRHALPAYRSTAARAARVQRPLAVAVRSRIS
jgi:hypothetical protein